MNVYYRLVRQNQNQNQNYNLKCKNSRKPAFGFVTAYISETEMLKPEVYTVVNRLSELAEQKKMVKNIQSFLSHVSLKEGNVTKHIFEGFRSTDDTCIQAALQEVGVRVQNSKFETKEFSDAVKNLRKYNGKSTPNEKSRHKIEKAFSWLV